jgi:hypothetical protein
MQNTSFSSVLVLIVEVFLYLHKIPRLDRVTYCSAIGLLCKNFGVNVTSMRAFVCGVTLLLMQPMLEEKKMLQ